MLTLYMYIIFFTLSFTGSIHLNFDVGQHADIIFQYDGLCENNSFALSIGNRLPFYQAGQISFLGLYPNQQSRFQVQLKDFMSDENNNFCYISVAIESVHREDAGTYICQSNHMDDDDSNNYFFRLRVNVIYQPGKAFCSIDTSPEDTGSGWLALRCTAEAGYYLGKFECYQNGILVPPWKKPTQRGNTLKQSLWIQKAYPIFCCATAYNKHKSLCECNDFKWDPMLGDVTNSTIYPCAVTTISAGMNIKSTNENDLSPTITTKKKESVTDGIISEENNQTNISGIEIIYKKFVWQNFVIFLVSFIILVSLFIIIWRCACQKNKKDLASTENVIYLPQGSINKEGLPSGSQPNDNSEADTENIDVLCEDPKQETLDFATEKKSMHKTFQALEKQKIRYMRKRNPTEN